MSKSRSGLQQTIRTRNGEGDVVAIQTLSLPMPDGTVDLEVSFDLGGLSVPARRYSAGAAFVSETTDLVKVCFGQRKVVGEGWRSMVVLSLTPTAVKMFVRACEQFWPSVQAGVGRMGRVPTPLLQPSTEPEQAVELSVNIIAAAMATDACCLDCYNLSPFVVKDIQSRSEIALEPVVRIDCPTTLLHSVLDEIFRIDSRLTK